jgi:hypothetical protein
VVAVVAHFQRLVQVGQAFPVVQHRLLVFVVAHLFHAVAAEVFFFLLVSI